MKKKKVLYEVRYLDGTLFDRFADLTEAVLWAEMIDGTWENPDDPDDLGNGVRIKETPRKYK